MPTPAGSPGTGEPAAGEAEALRLIQEGEPARAEAVYRHLLELGEVNARICTNLAHLCQRTGRQEEQIKLLERALSLDPRHAEAHSNLGACRLERGEVDAAIRHLNRALELRPGCAEALANLGSALARRGDSEAAIARLHEALASDPDHAGAHNHLGAVLRDRGDLDDAKRCFQRALALRPDFPSAHNNLGIAQLQQGDAAAALASFRRALAGRPGLAEILCNLAIAHSRLGNEPAAMECLRQALANQPDHGESHHNLGQSLLLQGDYGRGWPGYEWRLRTARGLASLHARPDLPLWDGQALPRDHTLLIVTEQGLGDTLQFMRYLPTLRRQGIQLRFCAQEALHDLIRAGGIDPDPLPPGQADAVEASHWLPLLSLPGLLGVGPDRPIRTEPYLRCPEERLEPWRSLLAGERRPLIAITWQGNPDAEKTSLQGRSLPLEAFAPLAARSGGTLISLQKGPGSEQRAGCSFRDRFARCQERIDATQDFLDTAAIVALCDLVISCDTSVAHLAGGMGHETWLLLHHVPDWRWGRSGERSFWYPSMRLFRQRQAGDWAGVIERVTAEIEALEQLQALLGTAGSATPAP